MYHRSHDWGGSGGSASRAGVCMQGVGGVRHPIEMHSYFILFKKMNKNSYAALLLMYLV